MLNQAVAPTQLKREFSVADEYVYNRSGPVRWIISHLLRYPHLLISFMTAAILTNILFSAVPRLTGLAFDEVLKPQPDVWRLTTLALTILGIVLVRGLVDITNSWSVETLGQRMERDAREELYVSLLGKSQTFHNRQRVGDIMARATNDVRQLNPMMNPGVSLITESMIGILAPLVFIAFIRTELLIAPVLFVILLLLCPAPVYAAVEPGGRRAAMAFRRDERRADRDHHRHRGG
jgi:ATP-binding cassette subfamily B protein